MEEEVSRSLYTRGSGCSKSPNKIHSSTEEGLAIQYKKCVPTELLLEKGWVVQSSLCVDAYAIKHKRGSKNGDLPHGISGRQLTNRPCNSLTGLKKTADTHPRNSPAVGQHGIVCIFY